MGIRGMETYIERYTDACIRVKVIDLIEQYKKEYSHTPVIVIDGMSVMKFIYLFKKLSWSLGGQLKEYEEVLIHLIQTFQAAGAQLVFYFDGPCVPRKLRVWIKRRKDNLEKIHNFLDSLSYSVSRENMDYDNQQTFLLPSNLRFVTVYIASKYGCQVYNSSRECDLEIAEFAFRNRAMAILAQDSDFIIFDTAKYYLSMKHFNFNDMTTCIYDRNKLASSLGLTGKHLPLLATLLGNDVIPAEDLQTFHRSLTQYGRGYRAYSGGFDYRHTVFSEAANLVRKFPVQSGLGRQELEALARRVFQDTTKAPLIEESILSYDVQAELNRDRGHERSQDKHWDDILKKTYELHKANKMTSSSYAIITQQSYTAAECLEDYRKIDLPPTQKVLQTLRQKLYGILLHEKPGTKCVEELVVCSPDSFNAPVPVNAITLGVHHPGLLALWEGKAIDKSWDILAHTYKINVEQMKCLPSHLIVPAISFKYVKEYIKLDSWEWAAIISSTVLVSYYSPDTLSRISETFSEVSRPYRIYTILTRAYSIAIIISTSIGNPISMDMVMPINYQDGKLYHYKYQQAKSHYSIADLCDRNESAILQFNELQDFIL